MLGWLIQPTWHTFKEPIVFSNVFRGLCAGEADSADLAHIERNKVFRAFSRGCVLGWLIQPTWHTFKEPIVFSNVFRGLCAGEADSANLAHIIE